jgi:hypothetical protein
VTFCFDAKSTCFLINQIGLLYTTSNSLLAESAEYDDKLNDSVAIAGKRFDWMLGRLKVN